MKKKVCGFFSLLLVFVIFVFSVSCKMINPDEPNQTPAAGDYTAGNLSQTAGNVTAVTITAKSGKSPGAVNNIRYSDSAAIPQTAGTYSVTFDVAAASGWNVAYNLSPGNLTVSPAGGGNDGIGGGEGTGNMTWTAVADSTFGNSGINAIAWGNNKFVAVGSDGKMAYSTDGVTWTAVADSTFGSDNNNSILAIAWGNNKFVAVSVSAKMAYSPDGVTWTAVADSTFPQYGYNNSTYTASIRGIAYGNNKFVAVGDDAKMATSTDGITWSAVADSKFGTSAIYAIAYEGGRWVAGGASGKMAYSADGTTWSAVTNSTFGTSAIRGIAYGNGRWVAGGGSSSGSYPNITYTSKMATSPDGTTWTAVEDKFGDIIDDIAYGDNRFVAVGYYNGKMAYSTDGITWTAVEDSTFGTSAIDGIAYGNNRFVAVGNSGKMAYSD
jgi:hypothetical protein